MDQARLREDDPFTVLERRVEELARTVEALDSRLARLETAAPSTLPAVGAREAREPAAGIPEEGLPSGAEVSRVLALIGRTLIVFGGAYLLRATTQAGYLPQEAGLAAALVYALVWLFLADRAGARGNRQSAAFHGAAAVLIGLPLIWETTVRFQILGAAAAGAAFALFAAAALFVAWHREIQSLAWIVGLAAPVTALFLLGGTHEAVPFGSALIVTGAAGLALYELRDWHGAGWWLGLLGPFGAGIAVFSVLAQKRGGEPAGLAVGLVLAFVYLAAVAVRSLARRLEIDAFHAVQTGLAVLFGFGGAALTAKAVGAGATTLVGGLAVVLLLACYWAAFRFVAREHRRRLLLYSTLAAAFALAAGGLLLPAQARSAAWSAAAVLAGWQAVRRRRVTLSLHGAVYALAAAASSGLLMAAVYAFVAPAGTPWPPLSPASFLALAAAAALCILPVPHPAPFWKPYEGLTRVLQIGVFLWGAAGVGLHLLAVVFLRAEPVDGGLLAAVRTAVLVAVALLLGWSTRWERFREAGWLVYPTLLLAALKLIAEDFPQGRPVTLFVALALCGLAFIFAPRLARGRKA
jgi:hypothetical protein